MRRAALAAAGGAGGAALLASWYRSRRRVDGPWLLRGCTVLASTLGDAALPAADDTYEEVDVRLGADGLIEAVAPAGQLRPRLGEACVDARRKLLLPGFVNAHTHSTEMLSRGLIPPLPLDLWVLRLLSTIGDAVGRIAARLSYDTEIIDGLLVQKGLTVIASSFWLFSGLTVVLAIVPVVAVAVVVCAAVFAAVHMLYLRSGVQMQRLYARACASARSPSACALCPTALAGDRAVATLGRARLSSR